MNKMELRKNEMASPPTLISTNSYLEDALRCGLSHALQHLRCTFHKIQVTSIHLVDISYSYWCNQNEFFNVISIAIYFDFFSMIIRNSKVFFTFYISEYYLS